MDSRKEIKIDCIFFDFDGVLAESVNVKTEAFRSMYLKYGKNFANRVVNHHKLNGGVSRFDKIKIYNGDWLGQNVTDELLYELSSEFSKLVIDKVVKSDEVKGANNFLQTHRHYKKFVVTGTPTEEIIPILERRNINIFFDGIYGSPQKKDFWVKKILKEHSITPEQCLFVGDAYADYFAAKNNNITFILRETKDGEEVFKDFKGYKIKNIHELSELINIINNE